ncbi:MAG: AAA family ATPase [Candidatus Pacebacteria bacterium]|nr:AAA family ATPase [Candidatus Paceibacterota bacterium]
MTQETALSILQTGVNVFLTGEPGSGKTHTIRTYIEWLRDHNIEPAITASTGVAATHIHGVTIHSWSGIGITDTFTPYDLDRIAGKEPVAKRIQKTSVLIIDEVSMLSGTLLDAVDAICKQVRGSDQPFGGIQVVLVGDFFQLPPIGGRNRSAPFAFQAAAWKSLNIITCYLTEQHRQEDRQFLSLLNAIRSGSFAEDEAELLRERATTVDAIPAGVSRLYTHNADVDTLNNTELAAISGPTKTFMMESNGRANLIESLKRGCLSPEKLVLKVGAIVMCTKNNAGSGYVNGTLGEVAGFDSIEGNPIIRTLDEREIVMQPAEWVVEEDGKVRASIRQIPLRLAWAITVHKSQGQSLDAAAIDLSRAFEYGQGYVALSRVRTLEGLHLLGWSAQAAAVHPLVEEQDKHFQEASDAAEDMFEDLAEKGERDKMRDDFIRASGGKVEVSKDGRKKASSSSKQNTYEETLAFVQDGKSIEEIAAARGLTFGTICDHVEKLAASGRLTSEQATSLTPSTLSKHLEEIESAFTSFGFERLAPVFDSLDEKYTYDELKLARALLRSAR